MLIYCNFLPLNLQYCFLYLMKQHLAIECMPLYCGYRANLVVHVCVINNNFVWIVEVINNVLINFMLTK